MKDSENNIPIKVFVRIKPQDDAFDFNEFSITAFNTKNLPVEYVFDRVFGPQAKSSDIYKQFKPIITSEDSKNISVIAYGQTGSGKTFTMNGGKSFPGLITLILKDLLAISQISVSFIEIYNEKIIDLIDSREKSLREDHGSVFIQDLLSKNISSIQAFEEINEIVLKNRKTGETKLNKCSSRSHMIVQIKSQSRTLHLVDLAGSENNKRTGNEGIRMEESSNINSSLFVLNKVVNAIVNKEKRIPYRDSKLTRLLQNSIGGDSKCFLVATVINSIDSSGEVINTLNFASKSRKILNKLISPNQQINTKNGNDIFDRLSSRHYTDKNSTVQKIALEQNKTLKFGNLKNDKQKTDPIHNGLNIKDDTKKRKSNNDSVSTFPKSNDSSSSMIKNSFINRSNIEMTPVTKQKSFDCFLKRAERYELDSDLKQALETYKLIEKFADSDEIQIKIKEIQSKMKKNKVKMSVQQALDILNSGVFLEVKKISGVGDKRAQSIVDFVSGEHFFETLEDLKMIFSEKVVNSILDNITDRN